MEVLHFQVYRRFYTIITETIKVKDIVAHLFSKSSFGPRDLERLQHRCDTKSQTDAAELLLTEVSIGVKFDPALPND